MNVRVLLLGLVVSVLSGCVVAPVQPPALEDALEQQVLREALLAEQGAWQASIRIAVSTGGEAGSGRLEWDESPARSRLRFKAPVTRRGWELTVTPGYARLDGLDGGPFEGRSAEQLLATHFDWTLPLGDLRAWLRGARAPGPARVEFSARGLPAVIEQHGWRIEYRDFDLSRQPALPRRVFARSGEQQVRVQVDRWALAGDPP